MTRKCHVRFGERDRETQPVQTDKVRPVPTPFSPVLANLYLHYVFDLWAHRWRKRNARGDVILVRYADDYVVGFEHRAEAEQFVRDVQARLAQINLELQADKTRLLEFGRFAARDRKRRGVSKPETFAFLGFTFICGRTRKGSFLVLRQTMQKRLRAKLQALKQELRQRREAPIPEQGKWLRSVLLGQYRYYGVPMNGQALRTFRAQVIQRWQQALRRRSQRGRVTWRRMFGLAQKWLPCPRIYHPYPWERLLVKT